MSYEADIYAAAMADETLVDLIGTKFFWGVADGNTVAPYVVAQTVSSNGETAHDGSRDVTFPLVQFSCWAATAAGAIALRSAIKAALEGRNLPGTSNASLGYSGDYSTYEQQTKLHACIIDYRVSTNT